MSQIQSIYQTQFEFEFQIYKHSLLKNGWNTYFFLIFHFHIVIIGINPSRFVLKNSRTLLKFIVHRVLTMLLPFHNLDFQIFNVWPRKKIFFNLRFSILKSSILKQCCNFSSFERSKIYHDPRVLVSKSKHIFIARSMNTHANSPQNKGDSSNFLITKTKKSIEEI